VETGFGGQTGAFLAAATGIMPLLVKWGAKEPLEGYSRMSEQDNQLQPFDTAQGKPHMPENPTPQDYGFPEKPSSADVQRWQRQELYLDALARTGSSGAASKESGVPVATARSWDFNDTHQFKRRREMALERFMGKVEAEINRRGVEGWDEPLHHKGQLTGDVVRRYSDNLLMFRAKRLDPAYKDNHQPQQDSTVVNITETIINVRDYRGSNPLPASEARSTDSIDAEVRELGETEHN
jgi:hypothetical protein